MSLEAIGPALSRHPRRHIAPHIALLATYHCLTTCARAGVEHKASSCARQLAEVRQPTLHIEKMPPASCRGALASTRQALLLASLAAHAFSLSLSRRMTATRRELRRAAGSLHSFKSVAVRTGIARCQHLTSPAPITPAAPPRSPHASPRGAPFRPCVGSTPVRSILAAPKAVRQWPVQASPPPRSCW